MTSALAEALAAKTSSMFSTFGGNPVAAVAGLAVLDVIEEERLVERAASVGAYLRGLLEELAFGAVRGRGLLIGVELPDATTAAAVVDGLRDRGVLIGRTGRGDNVLKIRPPLVFEREHADLLVERLSETLTEIRRRGERPMEIRDRA
jgi:4-aminobutyrate aminotransferase-like enzyme